MTLTIWFVSQRRVVLEKFRWSRTWNGILVTNQWNLYHLAHQIISSVLWFGAHQPWWWSTFVSQYTLWTSSSRIRPIWIILLINSWHLVRHIRLFKPHTPSHSILSSFIATMWLLSQWRRLSTSLSGCSARTRASRTILIFIALLHFEIALNLFVGVSDSATTVYRGAFNATTILFRP